MEHANHLEFEINIDNMESVFMKADSRSPDPVLVRYSSDLEEGIKSHTKFIFLTDSIWMHSLVSLEEAIYSSFINDTRLKKIFITLYKSYQYKNLFILLKDILTLHPNLQSLTLKTIYNGSYTIPEDYFELLCSGLRHARGLKELTIDDTGELTNDKIIQMLTSAIQDNKTLTSLKLVAPFPVIQTIATSLKKNTRIKILRIEQFVYFSDCDAFNISLIKELLEANTSINTLLSSNIVYNVADVDPFMSLLETTTTLQTLQFPISNCSINGHRIDYQESQIFPKLILSLMRPNSPLRTLDIPQLATQDINTLFRALANNSTLTVLRLGKIEVDYETNLQYTCFLSINEDTINAWNELLTNNKTLKEICFNGLVCNKEELSEFDKISVDWFKHNKTLTKLDLEANSATETLLGDTLVHNKTLKALKCNLSFISNHLWEELMTNTTLTELDFSDLTTNYDFENATVQFMRHNTTVKKLTTTVQHSEDDLFFEELSNNNSITSYTNIFNGNTRPSEYSIESIKVLKNNWILTELDLQTEWYKALYEPILTRNRQFKLDITLVMHNIARQKPTMFPMEIWRLIFRHLTPDLSILV